MRKIVFPTDFSSNALNAFKYTVKLFENQPCEYYVIHAFADEVYNMAEVTTKEQLEVVREEYSLEYDSKLKELVRQIESFAPNQNHNFFTQAVFGYLVDEINDIVNRKNADLVVMGTRGYREDRNLTFGTNTLQVIKYIQCPVLSIPEGFEFTIPKSILFPSNFMVPYQKRELKLVAEIAEGFDTHLHTLFISNFSIQSLRQKENRDHIKKEFNDVNIQHHRAPGEDRSKIILEVIENLKIDLLVMVNSRYSYLENILERTTIDKISLYPRIPFLVLQNYHRDY